MGRLKDWISKHISTKFTSSTRRRKHLNRGIIKRNDLLQSQNQNRTSNKRKEKGAIRPVMSMDLSEDDDESNDIETQLLAHDRIIRNDVDGCRRILMRGFDPNQPFCSSHKVAGEVGGLVTRRVETSYIHLAIIYRRPSVLRLLLEAGACPLTVDSAGRSPLQLAVTYWPRARYTDPFVMVNPEDDDNRKYQKFLKHQHTISEKLFKLLVDYGAKLDTRCGDNEDTLLHLAAKYNTIGCVQALLLHGADVNAINRRGQTPLMVSLSRAHLELARLLITMATKINIEDEDGRTALHYACKIDNSVEGDIAPTILSCGALVDQKDKDGNTPLNVAAMAGNCAAVMTLLAHDADADLVNHLGRSALFHLLRLPQGYPGLQEAIHMLSQWSLYTKQTEPLDNRNWSHRTHVTGPSSDDVTISPPSLLDIAVHKTRRCLGYTIVMNILEKQLDWPHGLRHLISLS